MSCPKCKKGICDYHTQKVVEENFLKRPNFTIYAQDLRGNVYKIVTPEKIDPDGWVQVTLENS